MAAKQKYGKILVYVLNTVILFRFASKQSWPHKGDSDVFTTTLGSNSGTCCMSVLSEN